MEGRKECESDLCAVFVSVFVKREEAAGNEDGDGGVGKKWDGLFLVVLLTSASSRARLLLFTAMCPRKIGAGLVSGVFKLW